MPMQAHVDQPVYTVDHEAYEAALAWGSKMRNQYGSVPTDDFRVIDKIAIMFAWSMKMNMALQEWHAKEALYKAMLEEKERKIESLSEFYTRFEDVRAPLHTAHTRAIQLYVGCALDLALTALQAGLISQPCQLLGPVDLANPRPFLRSSSLFKRCRRAIS
tara:strand:+ start:1006 stop:1488 length:483 start_codon:yes stop_codon:yes gene_type:complete